LFETIKTITSASNFGQLVADFSKLMAESPLRRHSAAKKIFILLFSCDLRGHAVAQLVEACATSQNVAGSIPDGVIETFY
jgi:hypothetical protein